jgi:hypothetical protein
MIDENYLIDEIAIVILSCDKFRTTWEPCIDHLFNSWPDCPYNVYLLNNYTSSSDSRVIDLLVGEDESWSDSLKKGLLKLKQNRIFFIYDDSFITYLNISEIQRIFRLAVDLNLDSVAFEEKDSVRGTTFNSSLRLLSDKMRYRNSLFLNLIKRDTLIKLLKSGENAWQFEKVGNERGKGLNFYMVFRKNYCTYKHGIVKGSWMPNTYKYLLKNGYNLDSNFFPVFNYAEVLFLKVYRLAFFFYNKLRH